MPKWSPISWKSLVLAQAKPWIRLNPVSFFRQIRLQGLPVLLVLCWVFQKQKIWANTWVFRSFLASKEKLIFLSSLIKSKANCLDGKPPLCLKLEESLLLRVAFWVFLATSCKLASSRSLYVMRLNACAAISFGDRHPKHENNTSYPGKRSAPPRNKVVSVSGAYG